MLKVFHFVSTNILSGLENVVINICTLVKGCDFTYVSPDGPINKYLYKYHIKHISIKKITPLIVRKVIKKYRPNVVHGHDVKASLSLAINSHLCHKYNIKVISELHNDDPRMWRISIRSLLYLLSSPFYDDIIFVSKAAVNHYLFKNLIKKKVYIIPNIVNIDRINKKYFNNTVMNCKYWDCIFIGRLANQKDPLKFVQTIYLLHKKRHNIKALMIGDGPLYKEVNHYIYQLKLKNNIIMLGFESNPYKYLVHSKVCVVPSKFEGFGLVALESLIMGVPVISSPIGGLLNIVNDKCGGFAINPRMFCSKINVLLNNGKLYKLMCKNAINHSVKINNIKSFSKNYFNHFNRIY